MWRIAILIIAALAVTMPVQAKSKKHKKHETSQEATKGRENVERLKAFSPAERNLIRAQMLGQESLRLISQHRCHHPTILSMLVAYQLVDKRCSR